MRCAFVKLATGVMSGALVGALLAPVAAAEMKPDEARRFIAGKLFSYSCFDGTKGAGRIHADGSVVGTMQVNSGRMRFVALPAGTIRLTSDSICASLPHALFQPCFNVVQTSPSSFRGSLKAFGFAYCDFQRHNGRMDLARNEDAPVAHTAAAPHPTPLAPAAAPAPAPAAPAQAPAPAASAVAPAPAATAAAPSESSAVALRPSHY
jgi:pyruvate/2-oxoglutarate dehydrogenase complex dihydrolipoamide acyltransferase (E2) component